MSETRYTEFLRTKARAIPQSGLKAEQLAADAALYPFQRKCAAWALERGRAALFEDCGLGKTPQQLKWAQAIGGRCLIVAPLAVSSQTQKEGIKFGIEVNHARHAGDLRPGINITNYEMVHHFHGEHFDSIVLDESSILKNYAGKYRQELTDFASRIPLRLCCTATPAPNDLMEIGTHAEFLGIMKRKEMLATFFTHDSGDTQQWRIKGHAQDEFWHWMATWCIAIRKPEDLGFENNGFRLPPLSVIQHTVKARRLSDMLFPVEGLTLTERRQVRRASMTDRVQLAAHLAHDCKTAFLCWCDLNAESAALTRNIDGAVEVKGSDSIEHKEAALIGFSRGEFRVLVSKPSICGHGMNWQHCADMAFVGLSDSYEQYYQAVRRCWRFGQTRPVNAHIVISEDEGQVLQNVQRKEQQASEMFDGLVAHLGEVRREETVRERRDMEIPKWLT